MLSFGLEVKGTDNTLRFSNTPVSATATQIVQARTGYGFGFEMWGGQTRIDTQLFLSHRPKKDPLAREGVKC